MHIKSHIAAALMTLTTIGALLTATAVSAQAADTHAQAPAAQAAAQSYGRHLEAGLYGSSAYRPVRGHADYQSYRHRHLEVSLWNARRLAGHTLVIYVNGTRVGTMHIWGGGSGHFSRSSGIPGCSPGTAVRIRTRSGTLVASGTFHRMGMM